MESQQSLQRYLRSLLPERYKRRHPKEMGYHSLQLRIIHEEAAI